LARLFRDDYATDKGLTLRYSREEYLEWQESCYRAVPKDEIKARLSARIKAEFDRLAVEALATWNQCGGTDQRGDPIPEPKARRVTTKLVGDVLQALGSLVIVQSRVEAPAWLEGAEQRATWNPVEMLACRNALVNLPDFMAGRPLHKIDPTPAF